MLWGAEGTFVRLHLSGKAWLSRVLPVLGLLGFWLGSDLTHYGGHGTDKLPQGTFKNNSREPRLGCGALLSGFFPRETISRDQKAWRGKSWVCAAREGRGDTHTTHLFCFPREGRELSWLGRG